MSIPKYKDVGSSTTTPIENTERKEILLDIQQFSQTLDYSDFPDAWLPLKIEGGRLVDVKYDRETIAKHRRAEGSNVTEAIMTMQPRQLDYWHTVAPAWTVEEGIEVAAPSNVETLNAEDEIGTFQKMPEPVSDPYRVQSGDTLSSIATCTGATIEDLKRLNGFADYTQLIAGQSLFLSKGSAFGFHALFLDALRQPIENLSYKLTADGKTVRGKTDATGRVPPQSTRDARSRIEITVRDAQGRWHTVVDTVSGYGNKLITLVSGALVFPGQTEPHPYDAPKMQSSPKVPAPDRQ
jgi:LysM repeat protein